MIPALRPAAVVLGALLLLVAPAETAQESGRVGPVRVSLWKAPPHRVTATWYQVDGARVAWHYHGNPGSKMSPGCLTAAHPTLPFGTKLTVRRGKRSVVVTVTDRGPEPWTGAGIDLSKEAARRLGMLRAGRGKVTLER